MANGLLLRASICLTLDLVGSLTKLLSRETCLSERERETEGPSTKRCNVRKEPAKSVRSRTSEKLDTESDPRGGAGIGDVGGVKKSWTGQVCGLDEEDHDDDDDGDDVVDQGRR